MHKFLRFMVVAIGISGLLIAFFFAILYFLTARGIYTGVRIMTPFEEAHAKAVYTFVNSKGFGFSRFRHRDTWNEWTVALDEREYQILGVHLIGLTPEDGQRYYEERHPPMKDELKTQESRKLTVEELDAIEKIQSGDNKYSRLTIANTDELAVIAPLYATQSCIKCHSVEEGKLLGAFDYRLRPIGELDP